MNSYLIGDTAWKALPSDMAATWTQVSMSRSNSRMKSLRCVPSTWYDWTPPNMNTLLSRVAPLRPCSQVGRGPTVLQ